MPSSGRDRILATHAVVGQFDGAAVGDTTHGFGQRGGLTGLRRADHDRYETRPLVASPHDRRCHRDPAIPRRHGPHGSNHDHQAGDRYKPWPRTSTRPLERHGRGGDGPGRGDVQTLFLGKRRQIGDQHGRPLIAVEGILGHQAGDDLGESSGHVGSNVIERRGRLLLMLQQFLDHRAVRERGSAGEHEEDRAAE